MNGVVLEGKAIQLEIAKPRLAKGGKGDEAGEDGEEEEESSESEESEEEDSDLGEGQDEDENALGEALAGSAGASSKEAWAAMNISPEKRRELLKLQVATLSNDILEDPGKALRKGREQRRTKVELLLQLCGNEDLTVRRWAVLSLTAVFKDIIPGYKIGKHEDDKDVKLKKEVRKLHQFEASLLTAYQRFLKQLEITSRLADNVRSDVDSNGVRQTTVRGAEGRRRLALTAIKCMVDLLRTHPHFNFRANLVAALVPRLNHHDKEIRGACEEAIVGLFKEETEFEAALEVVKGISKLVKSSNYQVTEEALRCLLKLPLHTDLKDKDALKKKRKRRKGDLETSKSAIQADLDYTSGTVDKSLLSRRQADALKELFTTYFRILKYRAGSSSLPHVLEGIAKFSHLINVELVVDLLEALKTLIKADTLGLEASLNVVVAALSTMEGPGQALQIDDRTYKYACGESDNMCT